MDRITFLMALAMVNLFTNVGQRTFLRKRPIYSQNGYDAPSGNDPKDLPEDFLPVMMVFDGEKFISIDGSQRLQVNLPAEGEESVHDFQEIDLDEVANYYFFFTKEELTEAGFDISRKPGFNYWNPEALRWEPRGHVLENSWADHRFYVVSNGYFAVCYELYDDGNVCCKNSSLPVFEQNDISSAWGFQDFFSHPQYDSSQDFGLAYFFIEFSLEELRAAGIKVPTDLTGYRFNPESALFEEVEKPATPCGWDPITQSWRPICVAEDDQGTTCTSGKFAFPWQSNMSDWILEDQNVHTCMSQGDIGEARRKTSLMRNFFSENGGPYCDCNCFCTHCRRFHLPGEGSRHRLYGGENILSEWTCD